VDAGPAFIAYGQPAEGMQPGRGALSNSAIAPQALLRFAAFAGQARDNMPSPQGGAVGCRVLGFLRVRLVRPPAGRAVVANRSCPTSSPFLGTPLPLHARLQHKEDVRQRHTVVNPQPSPLGCGGAGSRRGWSVARSPAYTSCFAIPLVYHNDRFCWSFLDSGRYSSFVACAILFPVGVDKARRATVCSDPR
jgi:hypothetical protein